MEGYPQLVARLLILSAVCCLATSNTFVGDAVYKKVTIIFEGLSLFNQQLFNAYLSDYNVHSTARH
jgi:hypothetical protein